jgi:hypothetical protein
VKPAATGTAVSATVTTLIGRPAKIGHAVNTASAPRADFEPSSANAIEPSRLPRATSTGHGAWSTTSAAVLPRTIVAIVP